MSIADLYKAIKLAKRRPKAIAVSTDTWNSLKKAGVVEMKTGHSIPGFRDGDKFPVLMNDICIFINPALDAEKKSFLMPPDEGGTHVAHAPSHSHAPPEGKPERRKPSERRKGARRRTVHIGRDERRAHPDRRKGSRRGSGSGHKS
jgi:hypothetical protein